MGVIKSNRMAHSSLRKQTIMRLLQLMVYSAAIAISFVTRAQQMEDKTMYGGHPVFQGYWHNSCGAVGYLGGTEACLQLTEVPTYYNVVAVAYMKSFEESEIPTFSLNPSTGMTEETFLEQVRLLNSQGRVVIISLGGPESKIALPITQGPRLTNEIIRLVWTYGFNGLSIDLEEPAIYAGSNLYVIPQALISVRRYLANRFKYFSISASPGFHYLISSYLIGSRFYQKYFEALGDNIDWISPRFFNEGGYGISTEDYGYIYQADHVNKEHFIYHISDAIVNGKNGFYQIPNDKLVFGIPANIDAAIDGYVENPQKMFEAVAKLHRENNALHGIMTWSINWDMGADVYGNGYDGLFSRTYGAHILPRPIPFDDEVLSF